MLFLYMGMQASSPVDLRHVHCIENALPLEPCRQVEQRLGKEWLLLRSICSIMCPQPFAGAVCMCS
jgi:hypothetical protein